MCWCQQDDLAFDRYSQLCCTFIFFYVSAFIHLKICKQLKSSNWGQFPLLSSQSLFLAFPLLNKPLCFMTDSWVSLIWQYDHFAHVLSSHFVLLSPPLLTILPETDNLRGPLPFKSYHPFSRFPFRVLLLYMF